MSAASRVTSLAIAPIRGFGLSQLEHAYLGPSGVTANRRFFLVDEDGRRYTATRGGELFRLAAAWDEDADRLDVTLPSGSSVGDAVRLGDPVVTPFFGGRQVNGRYVLGPWSEASPSTSDARCVSFGSTLRGTRSPPAPRSRSCPEHP
jgi:MOSC N-terminal beta barrel domain